MAAFHIFLFKFTTIVTKYTTPVVVIPIVLNADIHIYTYDKVGKNPLEYLRSK